MENRIKNVMASVFSMPIEGIDTDASPHNIQSWDSLNHMKLITALEEEFNIRFEDDEIPSLVSYEIIFATVSAYLEQ